MDKFSAKGKVKTVKGTILAPENSGLRIVLNTLSLSGSTDSKLFQLFDKKWVKVKAELKGWYASRENFKLGSTNTTAVQSDTWIVTMLVKNESGKLDETALEKCLKKVSDLAKYEKASVHLSSHLTQEVPELVSQLTDKFVNNGVSVYLYEE